jgi:basic membrane protein A
VRRPCTVALGAVLLLASSACSTTVGSAPPAASVAPSPTASTQPADACIVDSDVARAAGLAEDLVGAGFSVRPLPFAGAAVEIPRGGCALVISVDDSLASAMEQAARGHPDLPFAAAGVAGPPGAIANLAALRTDARDAAFVAGYLAAALTRTGQIGAIGLRRDRAAEAAIQAFAAGAAHRAAAGGTTVRIRGGGPARLLSDQAEVAPVLRRWTDRGVDVLFAASADLRIDPRGDLPRIVVGAASGADQDSGVLARIVPDLAVPARTVAEQVRDGVFVGGEVTGSLADGGVRLDLGEVPESIADAVAAVQAQIGSGRRSATGAP